MSLPNTKDTKREFVNMIQAKTTVKLLEKLEGDKQTLRDLWPRISSWNIQEDQPRQIPIGSQYPDQLPLELSKYWDVCFFFIDYCLWICAVASQDAVLAYYEIGVPSESKKEKELTIDAPIKNSDDNVSMDIEISQPEANQLTSNTTLITKESEDDTSFQPVLSKSQKKKQCKKAKVEHEAAKANKSSASSLDPLAKRFTPPKRDKITDKEILTSPPEKKVKSQDMPNIRKVIENKASTVITGYLPAYNSQAFVQDIIVYDIPAKWDNITIINALSEWGKVISMTVKRQKKYKTLRVKFEMVELFRNYKKHWIAPLLDISVR
ncbi:hypothetical protein RclHR1_18050005 [Rhizophagus clarus]|uniref:Uncharacterized protein n=1 Tax=Rhizophagus clarus TaxID=94130 RepID=A0A2Z6QLR7_9GLOM|nr:hypothetical protein RclHR1_18050005 [Rhizophagus clarus]GES81382.1 hypothetical protein GLOIN_2v1871772 [Rhizophagus clarus]